MGGVGESLVRSLIRREGGVRGKESVVHWPSLKDLIYSGGQCSSSEGGCWRYITPPAWASLGSKL